MLTQFDKACSAPDKKVDPFTMPRDDTPSNVHPARSSLCSNKTSESRYRKKPCVCAKLSVTLRVVAMTFAIGVAKGGAVERTD
jgi:hypothetical protein